MPTSALLTIALLLPAPLASTVAQSATTVPSFACVRAATGAEALICREPRLALLDRAVAAVYRLTAHAPKDVQEQRDWITKRDTCTNAACVQDKYQDRLQELFESAAHIPLTARRDRTGTLDLVPLGGDAYAFRVNATWQGRVPGSLNDGDSFGAVQLSGGRGVYRGTECVVTIERRSPARWNISQLPADCGLGLNVSIDGQYLVRARKPR